MPTVAGVGGGKVAASWRVPGAEAAGLTRKAGWSRLGRRRTGTAAGSVAPPTPGPGDSTVFRGPSIPRPNVDAAPTPRAA